MAILKGVGAALRGFGKALTGKNKVSPTIKSVKPTTKIAGSVERTKVKESVKRSGKVGELVKQKEEGIKSARKAQRELQRMVDTKRGTRIGKSYFGRSVPATDTDKSFDRLGKRILGKRIKD